MQQNIKAEKKSIYIQEYKKIVAKIVVKLVTKKDRLTEDNNTVTMRLQDETE